MNARDPRGSAQDEFRAACEALAVLEQAVPAFRELVGAFRAAMHRYLALDAATSAAGLTELAQTLSLHAIRLSEGQQIIASNVVTATDSFERYRTHLHAVGDGRSVFGELQGTVDNALRGIADIGCMVEEAEHLLEGEVQRIQELALQFDLPAGVEQLARQLIDRAKR